MKTYKVAGQNDTTKEVEASAVQLFPWIETIVHRDTQYAKSWTVSEVSTGYAICHDRTRKETIEKARKILVEVGEKNVLAQIEKVKNYKK